MSGKYFDVPCGKCSRELHWDDDCAEVPGGAIWCACCIDAKTRHDELASERAAGRMGGISEAVSLLRERGKMFSEAASVSTGKKRTQWGAAAVALLEAADLIEKVMK